jgi:hypothetical protein
MTRAWIIRADVDQDIRDCHRYHEGKEEGLCDRLSAEHRRALARVMAVPGTASVEVDSPAELRVFRFSESVYAFSSFKRYATVFVDTGDPFEVVALRHGRRSPSFWRDRLSNG